MQQKVVAGLGFEPGIPQPRDYEPDELPGEASDLVEPVAALLTFQLVFELSGVG